MDSLIINYDAQIINELASNICDLLINNLETVYVRSLDEIDRLKIRTVLVTDLDILKNVLDLDKLHSEALGITNPIGQLSAWLSKQFSWLVRAVENVFRSVVSGFVSAIHSFLSDLRGFFANIANQLMSGINSIINYLKPLTNFLSNMINNIRTFFASAFAKIANFISSSIQTIINFIRNIPQYIQSAFRTVYNVFSNIYNSIVQWFGRIESFLSGIFNRIVNSLNNVFTSIVKYIESIPQYFESFIQQVSRFFENIPRMLQTAFNNVINFFRSIGRSIIEGFERFSQLVQSAFNRFAGFIRSFAESIVNFIRNLPSYIYRGIEGFVNWLKQGFKLLEAKFAEVGRFLSSVFHKIVQGLTFVAHAFQGFVNAIMHFPQWFPNWFYQHIAKPIVDGFQSLAKWIWDHLPKWLRNAIEAIGAVFEQIYNFFTKQVPNFFTKVLPEFFTKTLPSFFESLPQAIQNIGKWIWEHLPDWLKNAFEYIGKVFEKIYEFFTKTVPEFFTKTIPEFFTKKLPEFFESIPKAIQNLGKWIWDHLPEWLKDAIKAVQNFFKEAYDFFTKKVPEFFKNLPNYIKEYIVDPVVKGFEDLFKNIYNFITKTLIPDLVSGFEWFITTASKAISSFAKTIYNVFVDLGKAIWSFIIDIAQGISNLITIVTKPIADTVKSLYDRIDNLMKDSLIKLSQGKIETQGELGLLVLFLIDALLYITPLFALPFAIEGLSKLIERLRLRLAPLGVGMGIVVRLSAFLEELAHASRELWRYALEGLFMGFGIASGHITLRVVDYYFRMLYRNIVPVELPSVHECIELIRRSLPTPLYRDVYENMVKFLMMRGYSDGVLTALVDTNRKMIMSIKDRFGTILNFDTALLYRLPTHTEICSFMMRDLFSSFTDFAKLMMTHGYEPSSAYMIWLLHFKYPTLKEVWEFTCRAIAGECWISKDSFIYKSVLSDYTAIVESLRASGISANLFVPVDTASLNMTNGQVPSVVLEAIPKYARWLAKAPFSWINNYTSDVLLYIDILAKVPTKIDLRWMVRYGIFESWSAWGITFSDNLESIHNKLIIQGTSRNPTPVYQHLLTELKSPLVTFDLRQFCRMLMAEGHHPYWIPWIAIAESQIAFQSEKTLLRTGFLELYRTGLIDINMLNELLSGFFTVKYLVSYFDLKQNRWFDAEVDIPVMYIPVESKLLELRSVMDRAERLFRELLHIVGHGIRVAILSPDEALSLVKYFVEGQGRSITTRQLQKSLSAWFSDVTRAITGKSAKLNLDIDYLNMLLYLYDLQYFVEIYERVRYWFIRIIASSIYRIMYGYVKPQDIEKIVELAVKYGKLTTYEANALKELLMLVAGIAKREYVPTPIEIAHLAEYVPEATKLLKIVFEERNIPQEFRDIFTKYVMIRPIIDDIRRYLHEYERAVRYGLFTIDKYREQLQQFRSYGYTDTEIKLNVDSALIDKAIRLFDHIIPTLIGLTTYYRYVPYSLKLLEDKLKIILSDREVFNIVKITNVDQLIDFYKQLAINRSVYPYLRGVIYELIYLYGRGIIDDNILNRELNNLKKYGLNDYQIELIKLRARLRRLRYVK